MWQKIMGRRCRISRFGIIICMIFCSMILSSRGEESKHRIVGLSEPSREQDLRDLTAFSLSAAPVRDQDNEAS